ncbi:unnamed protein product, partial [Polarella glacialis]
ACLGLDRLLTSVGFDGAELQTERPVTGLQEDWLEQVPGARTWSPSDPQLHSLTVSLRFGSVELDRVTVRFGLRTVTTSDSRILINGEPVLLLGVNRHESHPLGGIYLPHQQLIEDLKIIRELGANFVRGAHYSQDQRFLDLCDEFGVLVWEETMSWQPSFEDLQDPIFMSQQLQMLDETIDASVNHPSVI